MVKFNTVRKKLLHDWGGEIHISKWENEKYSFPIIQKTDGGSIVDLIFIYMTPYADDDSVGLPRALVKFRAETGEVFSYEEYIEEDEDDICYKKYHRDIKNYRENLQRLYMLHDQIREFAFSTSTNLAQTLILAEYKGLLAQTMYPRHMRYYLTYGKEFWDWLESQVK